jgi:uncharacterized protein (TIGR03032 family)
MAEQTLDSAAAIAAGDANSAEQQDKVDYSVSPTLLTVLGKLNVSICMTSYQSGRFYLIGRNPKGGIMINEQVYEKAMGTHVEGNTIILATLYQIHCFENTLQSEQRVEEIFDACYVPRVTYNTGYLDAHDVSRTKDGDIVFINTRFNCIAKLSTKYSFETVWKPDFISGIVDEDRCHLNGMAMRDGKPAYVTAASKSNTVDGWRDRRNNGGVVIDVQTNKVICEGLSMPHSPRIHNGKLYVLDSGTGRLGTVEQDSNEMGRFEEVTFCPGFVRGLSFHGDYAFVGLSKPRYERFEGLALDEKLKEADSEPWCGIQIIDLKTKTVAAWFRIDGAVQEMFDVNVVPDVMCGMSLGFHDQYIRTTITHSDMAV